MTPRAYTLLQARREVIASRIRHALMHDRGRLPALYAEARGLVMESLRAEVEHGRA